MFEEVLSDYTDGMAVISALNLQQAQMLAHAEFGCAEDQDLRGFLIREPGFMQARAVYQTTTTVADVLHYVYGGS